MMYKGGIKIMLLLAIVVIIFISASIFGFDTQTLSDDAKKKAADVVSQNNQKVVDKVVEEGRAVVGEKLKETGEKMLANEGDPGEYHTYDESMIGKRTYTVIFFTAPWCPSCVQAEQDITQFRSTIPTSVTIMAADYEDTALREKYHVDAQHTFILLDASGGEAARWTNSMTLQEIISHITI